MSGVVAKVKSITNWNLLTALCIRRPAIVTPELLPVEKRFTDLLAKQEFENSYLSMHEYNQQVENELLNKALKDGIAVDKTNLLLTTREKEIIWESEAEKIKPIFSKTIPDKYDSDNLRTTLRVMDRPLILLQQESNGFWSLPTLSLGNSGSLREVALNISLSILPKVARCNVIGNAPSAVYVKSNKAKDSGSQTYFFNAYVSRSWNGENVNLNESKDFAWVTKLEMQKMISDKSLLKVLNSFIHEY